MQVPSVTSAKYHDNIWQIVVPYYRSLYSLQSNSFVTSINQVVMMRGIIEAMN